MPKIVTIKWFRKLDVQKALKNALDNCIIISSEKDGLCAEGFYLPYDNGLICTWISKNRCMLIKVKEFSDIWTEDNAVYYQW